MNYTQKATPLYNMKDYFWDVFNVVFYKSSCALTIIMPPRSYSNKP